MINVKLYLLIEKDYLLILVTLAEAPCFDEIGKKCCLCKLIEKSDVFCCVFSGAEFLKIKEVS